MQQQQQPNTPNPISTPMGQSLTIAPILPLVSRMGILLL